MCICDQLPRTKIRARSVRKIHPEAQNIKVLRREVIDGRLVALIEGEAGGRKFSKLLCSGDVVWFQKARRDKSGRKIPGEFDQVFNDTINCSHKNKFREIIKQRVACELRDMKLSVDDSIFYLINTVGSGGYVGQHLFYAIHTQEIMNILIQGGVEANIGRLAISDLFHKGKIRFYGTGDDADSNPKSLVRMAKSSREFARFLAADALLDCSPQP